MSGLPQPGDIVDGKYRIEREIGRGGMAVVFAATQLLARREVAMKWLLPQVAKSEVIVERFLREAQAAARIDHPNVVSVLDVGRWGESGFYLVMEMLNGENVRQRLERDGVMPPSEALAVGSAVVGGVYAAHRAGVVHRDIKPENVFLRRDERGRMRGVKVLDFGISKLSESESLTLTGAHFGTAYYLAPEQASGVDRSSPRIDIYQVGVLFYEMLSGRRPYEGDSPAEILVALMTTHAVPLHALRPDLPPQLCAIIDRAMARDPAARPLDLLAFARDLRAFTRIDDELEGMLSMEANTQLGLPVAPAALAWAAAQPAAWNGPPSSPGVMAGPADSVDPNAVTTFRASSVPVSGAIAWPILDTSPKIQFASGTADTTWRAPQAAAVDTAPIVLPTSGLARWAAVAVVLAGVASLGTFAGLFWLDHHDRTSAQVIADPAPAVLAPSLDAGSAFADAFTITVATGIDPPTELVPVAHEEPSPRVSHGTTPTPVMPPEPQPTGPAIHEPSATGLRIVPVDTTEPVRPTEPVHPTEPAHPTAPVHATEPAHATEPVHHARPDERVERPRSGDHMTADEF